MDSLTPISLCDDEGKFSQICEIPDPDLSIHFATYMALWSR